MASSSLTLNGWLGNGCSSVRGMETTTSPWGWGAGASFTLGGLPRHLGGDVLGLFKISHLQRTKKRASSDVRFRVLYEVLGGYRVQVCWLVTSRQPILALSLTLQNPISSLDFSLASSREALKRGWDRIRGNEWLTCLNPSVFRRFRGFNNIL